MEAAKLQTSETGLTYLKLVIGASVPPPPVQRPLFQCG